MLVTFVVVVAPIASRINSAQGNQAFVNAEASGRENDRKEARELELHKPVEDELSAVRPQYYSLSLISGQYLRLNIECVGVNVTVVINNPSGRLQTESTCHGRGRVPVSLVADESGNFRMTVRTMGEGVVGRYRILVEEIRKTNSDDRNRIFAEQAFKEAEQLRVGRAPGAGLKAVGKYEEARKHWIAAGDYREVILSLVNTGQTYQGMSRFEQALTFYRQALVLSRDHHDRHSEAAIHNKIGLLQVYLGDNQMALAQATRALEMSRVTHDLSGKAQALHTMGNAYFGFGDLTKSIDYHRQALQIWRQLKDYQGQSEVLVDYGYTHIETCEIQAASDSFNQALSMSRATNDRHAEAVALRALGSLQTKLGENQQAFTMFLQALDILRTIDDPLLKATVLGGLAFSYEYAGERQRALEYYEQTLAIFKSINDLWGVAESDVQIGEIYQAFGEYEKAFHHYRQALSLFRALKMTRWEAKMLRNIGSVYDTLGDKSQALNHYRQSLALTRVKQDQRYKAYTLSYIGRIYESSGNTSKALSYYQQARQFSRIAVDPAGESLVLSNLAHLERDRGNLDKARAHIEDSIKIVETLRTKHASQDLRAAFFASARKYYDLYIDILMRLHERRPGEGFEIAAFEASESARARSLLESLREARANIRQGADPELVKEERGLQQLLNAKAEHHARLVADSRTVEAEALAREIVELTAQFDQVKDKIKLTSPRYAALTQPQPLRLRDIQGRVLDGDSLLLEYALGDDRSYLWAITQTEIRSFALPSRAEIEIVARRFYKLLTSNRRLPHETLAQYQARALKAESELRIENSNLSELVLGAVAPILANKRLLVVADGALQYIPFQALTLPERGNSSREPSPLILNFEVVNEPSASALALLVNETAGRKPARKAVAVLADPVFEISDPRIKSPGATQIATETGQTMPTDLHRALRDVGDGNNEGVIPRLFASRDEAEAIMAAAPWGGRFRATDFAASRATATNPDLSGYRIVHFATHGFLNNEHPELSGIVLSMVDREGRPQDGFLRLHDIYNLHLPVELVVLSACDTGLGKDVKGEGLIGLTRGFMYAGAASVVASLWKVDDEATAELMKRFYQQMLRKDLSPAAALRESQLEMLKQKRWRSPYFWAGFVIQGQYAKGKGADSSQPPAMIYLSSGGAALLAFLFLLVIGWRRRRSR
jgi:CHAT domain-containing protein/Tfp pilus assembly protein PilF